MRLAVILSVAGAAMIGAACSPAPSGSMKPDSTAMANDMAAITKVRDDWAAAWKAGNVAAIAALYAPGAYAMDNNAPTAVGPEGVTAMMNTMMTQMKPVDVTLTPQKTEMSGDMAYDRGMYHMTLQPTAAGAPVMADSGRYLVILRKQADGSWKLVEEIGNSPVPLPIPTMQKKGE